MYIGPEFQLGQVYDGTLGMEEGETLLLYRPVYACVKVPSVGDNSKVVVKKKLKSGQISDGVKKDSKSDVNEGGKKTVRYSDVGRNSVTDTSPELESSKRSNVSGNMRMVEVEKNEGERRKGKSDQNTIPMERKKSFTDNL